MCGTADELSQRASRRQALTVGVNRLVAYSFSSGELMKTNTGAPRPVVLIAGGAPKRT